MKTMLLIVAAMLVLSGCSREDVGPPAIRLGSDECSECGMTIHEERSAGSLLLDRTGRLEYVLFDDIGCMIEAEHSEDTEQAVRGRFVRDYANNAWLPAETAAFLVADPSMLRTPMGSGIAAFADRTAVEDARRELGGEVLGYAVLSARRQAEIEERRRAATR